MSHPYLRAVLATLMTIAAAPLARADKCPNLHVILDRSGSMTARLGNSTRMDVAKDAVKAVVNKYDGIFPIGLSNFPNTGCDAATPVLPAYKTKMAIEQALANISATGSTPSGNAVKTCRALAPLQDPTRKQYFILITDGGPGCGGGIDTCDGTVAEIQAARMQKPPIDTFVVGFGGGLATSEAQCLTRMAEAGGRPAATMDKFYKADDAAGLNKALEEITKVIEGEFGMGRCDDTCYTNGCPPGQLCLRAECRADPCAGVRCPADQYCYSDGSRPGTCVKACAKPCPEGKRCYLGSCIDAPCGLCPPNTVCSGRSCVPDAACMNLPFDKQCRGSSACRGGECIDDPCRFVKCPGNANCIRWDGSCENPITVNPMNDMGDEIDPGTPRRGCAALPGEAAASLPAGLYLASLLFLTTLRRRRR